ncbi:MAG: NUDIX pyrophosphatase [Candidatus Woesearchaeota archaeon]
MKKTRIAQLECIVFRKNGDTHEFLLLKRIPEKGEFWQPVSGGFEAEDSSRLEGAYRELLEETSISKVSVVRVIEDVHRFEFNRHHLTDEPTDPITEYVYGFEVAPDTEVSISNNIYPEHTEFRWVSFAEAIGLLKWDNNKDALKKLNELLS